MNDWKRNLRISVAAPFFCAALAACSAFAGPTPSIVRSEDGRARLHVGGEPFVILGGELLNSSGSTAEDMLSKWDSLKGLNLNTVLVAVAWEQVERTEGNFDFSVLKSLIAQARERGVKLVPLWFGSWKNGSSGYAPHWVMRDTSRFPRMVNKNGENRPYLSNLSPEVLKADKRAFSAMMEFIKNEDPRGETVIMVQIENEIGLLDDSRDRSPEAEKAFREKVPEELLSRIGAGREILPEIAEAWERNGRRRGGSWEEVFGQGNALADEMFMAWHYGRFVEELARAGKKIHNIPMYVNAWTISPGNPPPGSYPSGGPNHRMIDVWQAAAPSVDFLAVDNYQREFVAKCRQFVRAGNPLFVPEACALWEGDSESGPAKAFYTIGELGAIGFSPFAIDYPVYGPGHPLADAYGVLANLMPEITKARAGDNMRGFMQQAHLRDTQKADSFDFGDIRANVHYNYDYPGYGLIIRLSKEEFLVAGSGIDVHFFSNLKEKMGIGYGLLREGRYEGGEWKTSRYLGGDEAHGGVGGLHMPPVYLKRDARPGQISVIRAHVFTVGNSTYKNTGFLDGAQ